ncbi:MAG TPA: hypothetical protein VMX15_03985 [Candidatus Heimdallarchaeota archaeon]|nr:hypothetical protein [Candidatus Heimdallarchaeota archaeon]
MIEIPRKYEAIFFGRIEDIKPSPDTIGVLLEMFRDKGLLPTTLHEIRPPGPIVRLMMLSPDNEWAIHFLSERIIFQKNMTKPKGANMGTLEEFGKEVAEFSKRILQRFPIKGTRLALVTGGMMTEMTEESLQKVYEKLFHPVRFYVDNPPTEWRSRSVARFSLTVNGREERLNVLTDVNRVWGEFGLPDGVSPFDRIEVGFDINTFHGNVETRFDAESVADFYPKALKLRTDLLSQVEVLVNE